MLIQKESRRSFLPITYLLTYLLTDLLTDLLTYLLTYFNHVACSVALQPTAQLDAGSVALHSVGFPTRRRSCLIQKTQ